MDNNKPQLIDLWRTSFDDSEEFIKLFFDRVYKKENALFIEKDGKIGRKVGSVKTVEQMKTEYREVINLLRKGYSIRDVAKLSGKGISTVQRVKKLFT